MGVFPADKDQKECVQERWGLIGWNKAGMEVTRRKWELIGRDNAQKEVGPGKMGVNREE
jgi:hypothetical protein